MAAFKAFKRAGKLYVLADVASPWAVLFNILTLHYPFFMTDILVLYSLLMLGAPK